MWGEIKKKMYSLNQPVPKKHHEKEQTNRASAKSHTQSLIIYNISRNHKQSLIMYPKITSNSGLLVYLRKVLDGRLDDIDIP